MNHEAEKDTILQRISEAYEELRMSWRLGDLLTAYVHGVVMDGDGEVIISCEDTCVTEVKMSELEQKLLDAPPVVYHYVNSSGHIWIDTTPPDPSDYITDMDMDDVAEDADEDDSQPQA